MGTFEVIAGRVVNPGAAVTALTANTGDSFSVRSVAGTAAAYLVGLWAQQAATGVVRVRSNRMHDASQSIRVRVAAGVIRNLLPDGLMQPLLNIDNLTFEQSGGAAETDAAAMLLYYPSLGPVDQYLTTWDQVKNNIRNVYSHEVPTADPTTSGDWSAGTAFNPSTDAMKPGVRYAVLGYDTDVACTSIALRGADTANVRFGGPGPIEPMETRDWFSSLSQSLGVPAIPIIKGENKATLLSFVQRVGIGGTNNISWILAELAS